MTKSCLLPDAVVKDFDVFCDLVPRLLAGSETPVMHQFSFQRAPATFHRRVMPRGQASRSQQLPFRLIDTRIPNCRSNV